MRDMTKCGPGRYDLVRTLGPLELPRCEAPQVKVDFVAFGIVVVTGELYSYSSSSWLMVSHRRRRTPDAPAPDPSSSRRGSLPVRMAKRANSRRGASSGMGHTLTPPPRTAERPAMSRDNKPKAHRHGTEAQSNSRALAGASTGLEVVCARRVMLAIQELAIRVGRNRTAKLHRVPAIPQRLGTPRPFDPQLSSRLLGTRPDVGRVGLSGNHPLPNLPGRRMASSDRRVDRLRQLGGGGVK
jgi:hypothetical protein